ncbi:hypothetical protein ACP70R_006885 [Stipagrostis hirtigluma subsp. patula]
MDYVGAVETRNDLVFSKFSSPLVIAHRMYAFLQYWKARVRQKELQEQEEVLEKISEALKSIT